MDHKLSYNYWVENIQKRIDEASCQWSRVGIWGFPTKDNDYFHDIIIHYCHEYWEVWSSDKSDGQRLFNMCHHCGEETPDGIKMIALLEKL